MQALRPKHFRPDTSLPALLERPKDALRFVGRKVCKLFGLAWYTGTVTSIAIEDDIAYFQILYEADNDEEDMEWLDFREWAVVDTGTGHDAGGSHGPGPSELQTPAHEKRQSRLGGRGGAAGVGDRQGCGSEPDDAYGRSQPRKRMAAAPPSSQPKHPGAHSLPSHSQGAGKTGAGGSERELEAKLDPLAPEDSRPATRRRLDMEQDDEEPPHPRPQPQHPPQHQHARAAKAAVRRKLGSGEPFAAGHLHRIQLVNFMCHENLEVMFNKHVTFVTGRNGSGKSALLQGLQVCLGASARDAGRGSSLAGWVSVARRTATVTLDIWNTSEEEVDMQKWPPFRHDLYGSMIRIVRKISAGEPDDAGVRTTTATSYQLFAADGTEVKRDRMGQSAAKEVADLAEHFNVDASNPLIIITQDKSSNFHEATNEGARCKKYEMYMQGTCLAKTRDTLAAAQANQESAARNVQAHADRLRTRREELKALEARREMLQQADVYKQHLDALELATVWSIVQEARAGLEASKLAAGGGPARVAALEARVAEEEAAAAELQTREAALRDEMEHTRSDGLPARLQELTTRRQDAKRRRVTLSRQVEATESQVRDLHDKRSSLEAELCELEAEKHSEGLLAKVRAHQEQVEGKQAELAELQAAATQLEANRLTLLARLEAAEAAAAQHAAALDGARVAATEARDAHRELLAAAGGGGEQRQAVNARTWGHGVMALHAAVRAAPAGTFSEPPLGPMGLYLRRRADCDPALAPLLDLALGRCLELWLVNQYNDTAALRQLAGRVRCGVRPQVLVTPFRNEPHNYGAHALVDAEGRTWRRLIDLVEPAEELSPRVRSTLINALVDQGASAANIVLVGSREEGQVVGRQMNPALVQRRIRKAYDVNGFSYVAKEMGMITDSHRMPRTCRLAADNRAQLAESELAVQAAATELQAAEAAWREAAAAEAAARRERTELQRRQLELSKEQCTCQSQLQSLLSRPPSAVSEAQSQDLLNQLAAAQRELTAAAASQSDLEAQRNNALAEMEAIEAEFDAQRRQSEAYVVRRQELMAQINQLGQVKQQAAERLRAARERLQAARQEMQQGQASIDQFEREVNQAYSQASKVCCFEEGQEALEYLRDVKLQELENRFPNKAEADRAKLLADAMTHRGLQQWTALVSAKISRAEADAGGDLDTLRLQVNDARTHLARDKVALEAVAKKVNAIHEATLLRKAKYKGLRQQIEHVSDAKFARYMQRRNLIAALKLDHSEERLDLTVRKNHEAEQATSLMQLSGGERSFTTSAFLLAMGEVLDTPFRAMDEYDVFMDPSARKTATMALLEYAWKGNATSQLILLSPQDTATLVDASESLKRSCEKDGEPAPPKDFVKIVPLRAPRAEGGLAGPAP